MTRERQVEVVLDNLFPGWREWPALEKHFRGRAEWIVDALGLERMVPADFHGLLMILDAHYPADVFTGSAEDVGTRLVVLARENQRLRAALSAERLTGLRMVTHGRHCTCGACAAQDWTDPDLAPCGMHGPDCPALYQPWGTAGTYIDPKLVSS